MAEQRAPTERSDTRNPFLPRSPRYDFRCAVSFRTEAFVISGRCTNLSESGVLAAFDEPLEVWVVGELTFRTHDYIATVPAKVARVDGHSAGLVFRPRHDKDRETIALLVRLTAEMRENDIRI